MKFSAGKLFNQYSKTADLWLLKVHLLLSINSTQSELASRIIPPYIDLIGRWIGFPLFLLLFNNCVPENIPDLLIFHIAQDLFPLASRNLRRLTLSFL